MRIHNLAYKVDDASAAENAKESRDHADVCAACGEPLFGPDAEACSRQAWGSFWEITGLSNVELVCGACGEYLQEFFKNQ
jgi:peptide methionine sulfoxide reductase MsrB